MKISLSFHPKIFNLHLLARVCLGKYRPSELTYSVSSPGASAGKSLFHQTALCSVWREEIQRRVSGVDSRTSDPDSEGTCCLPSEGVKGSVAHVWLVILQRDSV